MVQVLHLAGSWARRCCSAGLVRASLEEAMVPRSEAEPKNRLEETPEDGTATRRLSPGAPGEHLSTLRPRHVL